MIKVLGITLFMLFIVFIIALFWVVLFWLLDKVYFSPYTHKLSKKEEERIESVTSQVREASQRIQKAEMKRWEQDEKRFMEDTEKAFAIDGTTCACGLGIFKRVPPMEYKCSACARGKLTPMIKRPMPPTKFFS